MLDYFDQWEARVRRLAFTYRGDAYAGKGWLFWSPDSGLRLYADLDTAPPMRSFSFPEFVGGLVPDEYYTDIRMDVDVADWALAQRVSLVNRLELVSERRLEIDLRSVLLRDSAPYSGEAQQGRLLINAGPGTRLFDPVRRTTRVGDASWSDGTQYEAGIRFEDDVVALTGLVRDEFVDLKWRLAEGLEHRPLTNWTRSVKDSLSILTGRDMQPLQAECSRRGRRYREIRSGRHEVERLIKFELFSREPVTTSAGLAKLALFMANESELARASRLVFRQVLDASKQRTVEGSALILSTAMEGLLRTAMALPFGKKGNFEARRAMTGFRETHLSEAWEGACETALDAYFKLRDKNAHPDWCDPPTANEQHAQMDLDLNRMGQLTRFYGQTILALADVDGSPPIL